MTAPRSFALLLSLIVVLTGPAVAAEKPLILIGQQRDAIDNYLRRVGTPDGFMAYTSIQDLEGLTEPAEKGGGVQHAQVLINRFPKAAIQLGLYMVRSLDRINAGDYDANITRLAHWIKSHDNMFYLRIGYEFDLPENRYDPVKYKEAFKRVVNKFREENVRNVQFVWHSAVPLNHADNYLDWYPGDDYVDWVAVTFFNPMQYANVAKVKAIAALRQKPFMIAESSPIGNFSRRGREDWFKHLFRVVEQNDVKVLCYINSNWDSHSMFEGLNWGDADIGNDPVIRQLWINAFYHADAK